MRDGGCDLTHDGAQPQEREAKPGTVTGLVGWIAQSRVDTGILRLDAVWDGERHVHCGNRSMRSRGQSATWSSISVHIEVG